MSQIELGLHPSLLASLASFQTCSSQSSFFSNKWQFHFSSCSSQKSWCQLDTPHPLIPHLQLPGKSCWLYLQNRFRNQPLIISIVSSLAQATIFSCLDYFNNLITGLPAFILYCLSLFNTAASDPIKLIIRSCLSSAQNLPLTFEPE